VSQQRTDGKLSVNWPADTMSAWTEQIRGTSHVRHQRRPPRLDPLDRLGAEDRDGLELDDDGRVVPCDGALVEGFVCVDVFAPLLPVPVDGLVWDGATASEGRVLLPLLVFGPEPVTPVEPLGRVVP
jgi:hypothetical protein